LLDKNRQKSLGNAAGCDSIALFCTTEWMNSKNLTGVSTFSIATLFINGYEYSLDDPSNCTYIMIKPDHTYLFDLQLHDMVGFEEALLKTEWNHAEVIFEDSTMLSLLKES